MNVDEILFRCSSLGHLFKEPKTKTVYYINDIEVPTSKINKLIDLAISSGNTECLKGIEKKIIKPSAEELAETTKTHLIDVYVSSKYNRFTEITAKQLDKGNDTEEDSITIVSRRTKTYLVKNEEHLSNGFIKGTPDLFIGKSIMEAEVIRDTKSSWDIYSFHRAKHSDLNDIYYYQLMGYMWLTGAKIGYVDYCLNNTPYNLVENELSKESYKHLNRDTPNWIELQIIANHTYDEKTFKKYIDYRGIRPTDEKSKYVIEGFVEVPIEERHFSFEVKRDKAVIEAIKEKVIKGRKFIKEKLCTH